MHIQGTDHVLISLSLSEVETIISALEIDWNEWKTMKAGVLLSQFQDLHSGLTQQQADISNDSV